MAAVTVFIAPGPFGAGGQFFDANGNPLALGTISTYLAGTTTPAVTYTGPGLTQATNANPIVLGPDGRPPQEIWIPSGVAMKFIVADSLGAQQGLTWDNLSGVNDNTLAVSEWVPLNLTPTQLSATTFSVPGNVTSILHADRRIQTVNAGGTLYGAIVSSAFAAGNTTVTVRNDTGQALDAGLSSVFYGFVSAFPGNTSVPMADTNPITGTTDATRRVKINSDRVATGQTRTLTMQDADLDIGDPNQANCRLTFAQGTAITTVDVLAATAIFLQPFQGNRLSLFDPVSGKWNILSFTSAVTVAVPGTTNQLYDVFAANSGGSVILEVVAWTNDTTRAVVLSFQDGVLVKSTDFSRRYMGSFRTTGVAGQSEDSAAKRYLWNYYNRVTRKMKVVDAAATWTYTTAAYRQANGNAANQLDFVVGAAENAPVIVEVRGSARNTNVLVQVAVGIGLDSTTVNSADICPIAFTQVASTEQPLSARASIYAGAGRHTVPWLEFSAATGTTTWDGTTNNSTFSGIMGELFG